MIKSQTDTTCGGWCKNVADSSSCSGCQNTDNCVSIPVNECGAGYWPQSNKQINGDWFPSRSTHYGGTSGGACGYGNIPNCYKQQSHNKLTADCDGVPDDITTSPFAGLYAAAQGDYYAQIGDFLSCGSCFEIYCHDPTCSTNSSIYVNICDSCPCHPNIKWCCNIWSHCDELRADIDGHPHCPVSQNGLWSNYSLHLDLSDPAFGMLTSGDRTNISGSGVVNTFMRRVSCPVKGNVYVVIDPSSNYNKGCYTTNDTPPEPCFYYLAVDPYNVGGYGAIRSVDVYAGILENDEFVYKNISLLRNPNFPPNKTQEQYGNWVNKQNQAIFMPLQFIIMDSQNRTIVSPIYKDFSNGVPQYLDIGVQFDPVDFGHGIPDILEQKHKQKK